VIARTQAARTGLTRSLERLGFEVFRSDANFVGVKVNGAAAAAKFLAQRGLGVRPFSATPVLGDLLRITVGPEEPMKRLVAAMEELPR
jgi:histidinol-phosphate aminotransferase